ncbi:hypothetical protein TEA_006273 [Camellia sinensis var. sinensis]|uniref:Alanine racemase N-terminal domain-containing protein n=1 Tax=Camellia sinensis var. sinensis TaxID=542762 RepID=A0A4V3WMU1_CAMSN|nr:hypothetical protein TEA_006273 [Camellia sinensis var. sinensis]
MVMMAATAMEGAASTALRAVLHRVRQAAERSGRIADDVRVVAVSKTKPISLIRQVYDSGHRCFGENYVQEIIEKAPQFHEDIEWHFVGHLQSNKVKSLLAKDCVPQFTTLSLARSKVMQSTLVAEGLALNGISLAGTLLAVSPVSPVMAPIGTAQAVAKELLNSILDAVVRIFGASDKCQKEKRKTINGDDLLCAMATFGFEDYIASLKVYLTRYREV